MSTDPNYTGESSERRGRLRPLTVSLIVAAVAVGGLMAASLAEAGAGWFGGWRHGHCRAESCGHGFDAERARDHAAFATGWVLRHVDASDEQEERIQGIVSSVIGDVSNLVEPHRADHDAFMALLEDEEIDRAKLEELRQQQIAMAETASRLLADAIADIAEVLTIEQRAELLEHARRHRDHGRR